jgi:hypothetical protein
MDLCARRPAVWRVRSSGRRFLLLGRPRWRAFRAVSSEFRWAHAGERLRRLQQALYEGRPQAGPHRRGGVLGACAARKFFDLARLNKAPISEINGATCQERAHVRNDRSRPARRHAGGLVARAVFRFNPGRVGQVV